jgi:predicted nucleic acid-binding protein
VSVVIDSSVAVCWFLPDEYSSLANKALDLVEHGRMFAPILLRYELQNVLLMNERRGRIAPTQVETGFRRFMALPATYLFDFEPVFAAGIVRRHALSAYDAAYIDVALRRGLPIATLDKRLSQAAIAEGIEIIHP